MIRNVPPVAGSVAVSFVCFAVLLSDSSFLRASPALRKIP